MSSPKYFFTMFGDPTPPEKDTIESGIYHPDPKHAPFPTKPGDILLLYCTGSYSKYPMQVPGLGIVLHTNDEIVQYRYLPLSQPISKDRIEREFQRSDADKFRNRRFSGFWLFEIWRESFVRALGDRALVWP